MALCLNQFQCIEEILLFLLSAAAIYLFVADYRKVLRDRNGILDAEKKRIFGIALAQMCATCLFFVYPTQLVVATTKCVKMFNDLLITEMYLAAVVMDANLRSVSSKLVKAGLVLVVFVWAYTGLLAYDLTEEISDLYSESVVKDGTLSVSHLDYDCVSRKWMLVSGLALLLSGLQAVCGFALVQTVQAEVRENAAGRNQPQAHLQQDLASGYYITVASLTGASFTAAVAYFAWEYIAYNASMYLSQCEAFFYSYSAGSLALLIALKVIVFFVPPIAVYYAFYWRLRQYIVVVVTSTDRNVEIFLDNRSELLRMSEPDI